MILAHADVLARIVHRTSLTNNDVASLSELTTEKFHSESCGIPLTALGLKTTPGFFDTSYSSFDEDDSEYLEDFVDDDSDDCSNSDDEEETTRFESEAQTEKTMSKVLLIWGIVLLGLIGFAFIMLPK